MVIDGTGILSTIDLDNLRVNQWTAEETIQEDQKITGEIEGRIDEEGQAVVVKLKREFAKWKPEL